MYVWYNLDMCLLPCLYKSNGTLFIISYDRANKAPPVTAAQIALDVVAMVRAHRNSPSVLLWSLCNEEGCFEQEDDQAQGNAIGAAVKQLILYHDGSRAVMAAMDHGAKYHHDQGVI